MHCLRVGFEPRPFDPETSVKTMRSPRRISLQIRAYADQKVNSPECHSILLASSLINVKKSERRILALIGSLLSVLC